MELLRVTSAGLKMADGTAIPVIRAVVRDATGSISAADANNFMREIYNRAIGCVSTVGFFTTDRDAFITEYGTTGSATFGNNTGFRCDRHQSGRSSNIQYSDWQAVYIDGLYYKGNRIAKAEPWTGRAKYECDYLVIFTDEDYHLVYSTNGDDINGIYIRYEDGQNPGATAANNMVVCGLWSNGIYIDNQQSWMLVSSQDSIKDDIINEIDPTITDPYAPGGASGTGGGTGDFDGTSEDIGIPGLPSMSAADTGFISLFNPSAAQLKSLANYMWGDVFDISTWKKIFADPMDAILGLSIVPVNVPSGGSATVTIGNISTGISMTKASSQYVSVDCGTINVNEYWGAYLDYSPYTKAEIYLPFVGTHPVMIDDIMGKPVHVVYHVDVLSGACCAYVQCGGTVLYSFVGQCSCSIPITANDWTNVINGALSIAGSIGSMVASGGATAPMAVTNIASTAVNSLKPDVEKSGSMGGMGGMLGVQKPYIILTRPRQALPEKQNTFTGYPAFITKKLSECTGYTEVESIHLENVPATQNELDEITELLKSGVII